VGASLLYYLDVVAQWAVIAGGAVNGVGAALLWTAQGRLMLQYSDGTDSGRIFAIFWSIFNMSAVLGGFITYGYFSTQKSDGNVPLFLIFLVLITIGGVGALWLKDPSAVHKRSPSSSEDHGDDDDYDEDRRALAAEQGGVLDYDVDNTNSAAAGLSDPMLKQGGGGAGGEGVVTVTAGAGAAEDAPGGGGGVGSGEISHDSWITELWLTLGLFQDRKMARLALIFWYTGFNQPYQLVTFGNRFFTPSILGLMLALFYAFEVLGAYLSAKIVDGVEIDDKAKATRGYMVFFGVTTLAYVVALFMEIPRIDDPDNVSLIDRPLFIHLFFGRA
jgi:hypothetical protein